VEARRAPRSVGPPRRLLRRAGGARRAPASAPRRGPLARGELAGAGAPRGAARLHAPPALEAAVQEAAPSRAAPLAARARGRASALPRARARSREARFRARRARDARGVRVARAFA